MTRDEIAAQEITRDPIFLLQKARIIVTRSSDYEYDSDEECLKDIEGNEVTEEQLLECGDAVRVWETESVWFTRAEAEQAGECNKHHYPDGWQVYCTNAEGELARLLKQAE